MALPLLGWLRTSQISIIGTLAGIGALLALAAWIRPQLLKPIFVGLCILFMPIGVAASSLVLVVLYYGVITPIGLFFRLMLQPK